MQILKELKPGWGPSFDSHSTSLCNMFVLILSKISSVRNFSSSIGFLLSRDIIDKLLWAMANILKNPKVVLKIATPTMMPQAIFCWLTSILGDTQLLNRLNAVADPLQDL